ncbi:hypothetical protein Y5W_01072 [Alcanivorax sp. 521-1]|uniref:DUF3298 domain-containing protein n=1 Tax=Alloalcanivorax profundimaris TaxID=2735259 RepID=A0ABS0ANX4_9GAMM|nr:DUF3298 and DUF4163 domain-containing protein [Alloalcanivorax profundimaris]MBF5055778.1 hypothetical protein [Alloalcanivorax profundimaris]
MPRLPGQSPFVITALAALTLSLAACDNSNDAASGEPETSAPAEQADGAPDASEQTASNGDEAGADPAADGASPVPDKLTHHTETLERRPEGCDGDGCPVFEVSLQVYDGQPALNRAVRERLTSQLVVSGEEPATPDSLEAAAEQFLATATSTGDEGPAWELSGGTQQVGRWKNLVTVAINSYEFTGGAHGMPITQWLNWDLAEGRPVTLGNLVETGREQAFWNAARAAHDRWLNREAPADDNTFQDDWPFQQTDSFRLTRKGVVLHYDVYSIAPYSMGQPEFTLPWDELDGVIRPRYRPD